MRIRTRPLLKGSVSFFDDDEDEEVSFVDVEPLFETIRQQFFRSNLRSSQSNLRSSQTSLSAAFSNPSSLGTTNCGDPDETSTKDTDNNPWSVLEEEFPSASPSECQRFWTQYGNDKARAPLKAYLEWRALYEPYSLGISRSSQQAPMDSSWKRFSTSISSIRPAERDHEVWEQAWEIAWYQVERCQQEPDEVFLFPPSICGHSSKKHASVPDLSKYRRTPIPQYLFAHYVPESNNILVQALPAQIDTKLACAEIHSLALALYFYDLFSELDDTNKSQLATGDLWLDVRGAPPWANPKPLQLIPLIRTVSTRLLAVHPERLNRLIVFPVPGWAVAIFNVISGVLPQVVRERTVLVAGNASHNSTLPMDKMAVHMDDETTKYDTLQDMERVRRQAVTKAERVKEQLQKREQDGRGAESLQFAGMP
ncbi:expressed unknown protein [Seminavis robusta]|uniref:CRAL-TRIO domain-containing protein n=1 Tax=Seminavis robusta TaxID=568900 RepID=A0A9N8H7L7_9STRA|nr:expressed unknown protein [Seminavis robusta]|eukprot:Sro133_g062850.1 n/a (424) ;mRNA; f:7994-9265